MRQVSNCVLSFVICFLMSDRFAFHIFDFFSWMDLMNDYSSNNFIPGPSDIAFSKVCDLLEYS